MIRRHRLIETFLVEPRLHGTVCTSEAEVLEHGIRLHGGPHRYPAGSPPPAPPGAPIPGRQDILGSADRAAEPVLLPAKAVDRTMTTPYLRYLQGHGFVPGPALRRVRPSEGGECERGRCRFSNLHGRMRSVR